MTQLQMPIISEDGKTLTITGKEAGETTITVTDGTIEQVLLLYR